MIKFHSDEDIWRWLLSGGVVVDRMDTTITIRLVDGKKTYNDGSSAKSCLLSYDYFYGKEA